MIATINNTTAFLNALKKFCDAFSVHEKYKQYQLNTLTEAIDLTRNCLNATSNIQNTKENNDNFSKTLNVPEGSIS